MTNLLRTVQAPIWRKYDGRAGVRPIVIDETTTHQTMLGFGAALTDASAYNLWHMPKVDRDSLLQEIFTPQTGMGLSILRVPMTASDFATADYGFSIEYDEKYTIPLLKQIKAINPQLNIVMTPWSAPAAYKDGGTGFIGGTLRPESYANYAQLIADHVRAYQSRDLTVCAVTVQNEPLFAPEYQHMVMSAEEQATFIGLHLGPLLKRLGVEIWGYDHNWDNTDYPLAVLRDPLASQYVAGTAWHAYAGEPTAQSIVHTAFPGKSIHLTEITGSTNGEFAADLSWHMRNIMLGSPNNWAASTTHWNLVLDERSGPRNGGAATVRPVITIHSATAAITRNPEYYAMTHLARFVQPGAVRLECSSYGAGYCIASAYRNPDGSRVLIILCDAQTPQQFQIIVDNQSVEQTLQPGDVMTYVW